MTAKPATVEKIQDLVRSAVGVAQDLKALDLRVLDLSAVSDFTDYFLICSGSNSRQIDAIASQVGDRLRDLGARPLHREGGERSNWILLDFGDFIVHVFDPERRNYYRLEDIWSDAEDVTERFAAA